MPNQARHLFLQSLSPSPNLAKMTKGLVKQFLETQKVGALVKAHTKELAYLRTSSTVSDALEGFAKNGVLSEPVLDISDEYAGCLSVGDLLKALVASESRGAS